MQTKMAILSGKLILLTILLYEQFIHHKQINLHPYTSAFEHSVASLSVFFLILPALIPLASLWHAGLILDKNVNMNVNNS